MVNMKITEEVRRLWEEEGKGLVEFLTRYKSSKQKDWELLLRELTKYHAKFLRLIGLPEDLIDFHLEVSRLFGVWIYWYSKKDLLSFSEEEIKEFKKFVRSRFDDESQKEVFKALKLFLMFLNLLREFFLGKESCINLWELLGNSPTVN